ncbi:hypothetical protein [Phyllobacterium lublinensis]|uniref:hypothetical protein n=1 Tax=Phyllobacterium lublinensis TaxID=2875708 RepID=UPI001CCED287|nr:hypothetical protein [Phyllobacterium sp. 2063]MBZ9653943.1 hypothetical protein [Phyllobacterium sp. 2063]
MTNTTYNLVLDHLCAIRADVASIKSDSKEMTSRMTALEIAVAGFASSEMNHFASLAGRSDRTDDRLDRIERRLEIILTPN